jgi:transcriptional antiterminator RfaH
MLDTHTAERHTLTPQGVGPADVPAHTPCGSRPGWAVIATFPRGERIADQHLRNQGFETYCPLIAVRRNHHGYPVTKLVPLFPRYSFVYLAPNQPWRPILSTICVHDLLRSGTGQPHIVPDAVLSLLQATEAVRRTLTPPDAMWRPGDHCQARHGPFQGYDAVVLEIGKHNAIIAMLLFGHLRQVCVPVDCLMPRE